VLEAVRRPKRLKAQEVTMPTTDLEKWQVLRAKIVHDLALDGGRVTSRPFRG
jgi:hypothetical protein